MPESETKLDCDDAIYRISPIQQALASCTGALLTSILMSPLDVVKIRLQAQQKAMANCFLYCNGLMEHLCTCNPKDPNFQREWYQRPGHFKGTLDAFVKITKNEGVTSLWSGLSPTLVLAVPATIVYFVTYEQLRLKLKDEYNKHRDGAKQQPFWIPLVSGATARIFSTTLVSPLELIRTKMQSKRLSYLEVEEALKAMIKHNGIFGLWTGIFSTLLRDVPFSAIYWMNYETIKSLFGPGVPSFGFSFLAGAISGSIAATITIPFDVVKTHQQLELGESHLNPEKKIPKQSTWAVMKHLSRTQGVKSLYTGLLPRLMKVAPACAIMIGTFEYSKLTIIRLANKLNEYEKSRLNQKEGEKGVSRGKNQDITTVNGVGDVL